jgi:hypothetical protein
MTGIILCGGKNTRMGENKTFIEVDGERIIDRTIRIFREIFQEIMLVTNEPLEYLYLNVKTVTDIVKGKAAVLVSSGTMGNLVSLLVHCERGDEIIIGDQAHIFYYEVGGMSALGGIIPHTVTNQRDGTMRLEDIEAAIRGDNIHYPRTRLICLELPTIAVMVCR